MNSLGLLGAYDSSDSDSSSASEDESRPGKDPDIQTPLSNPFKSGGGSGGRSVLPKPSFMVETTDFTKEPTVASNSGGGALGFVETAKSAGNSKKVADANSVFANPFKVQEDKKKAILEKHVQMTVSSMR